MRSLTVTEARERATLLRVDGMDVELELSADGSTFVSRTTIAFTALGDGSTFFEVRPERLRAVRLDDRPLDPARLDDGRYPLKMDTGAHTLVVDALMAYSHDGEGLHRSVDPADGRTYTYLMSFLDAAPRCFACFDQPDLKAPYRLRVTTPTDWTVVGNGRATRADQVDGTASWQLAETRPLATYFVTLVAGPYHSLRSEHDGIRLGAHVKQSLAAGLDKDADEIFEVTAQAFDRFHELFGIRYPFGDYHQAFVPEFNAGAMENPGCVTFADSMIYRGPVPTDERSFRAKVIVHEMAHMWFGDLVTMRWWDDLWLNESFADYMAYRVTDEATRFTDSWVELAFRRKRWGMLADQRPSTHPVAGNGAADAQTALQDFDGISYAKGAAVLKQLAAWLGDDVFLDGVRDHLTTNAFGNATLADLLASWERAGARDLRPWARAWLRESGADTLRVDGDALLRLPPAGAADTRRSHRLTLQRIAADGTIEAAPLTVTADRTPLPLPPAPGHLLVPDACDETWAKVRLDATTLSLLPERLPEIADPVTRGAVWLALQDSFEDAELDPALALDLLGAALPCEDEDVGIACLTHFAVHDVLGRAVGGDQGATDAVAVALSERLATTEPGSPLQLAAARALLTVAGETRLDGWLAGRAPEGLVMDADLRWRALSRLCRLGAAGLAQVRAEQDRDRSHEGEAHAVRCRASLPDAAAKADAWDRITGDADSSNSLLYAACEGFWWPEQQALTAAYVPRYFVELPATGSLRQGWVVAESARLAYPAYAVDAATLEAADQLLADASLDRSLRRAVVDSTDELRRSLAVRRRWPR